MRQRARPRARDRFGRCRPSSESRRVCRRCRQSSCCHLAAPGRPEVDVPVHDGCSERLTNVRMRLLIRWLALRKSSGASTVSPLSSPQGSIGEVSRRVLTWSAGVDDFAPCPQSCTDLRLARQQQPQRRPHFPWTVESRRPAAVDLPLSDSADWPPGRSRTVRLWTGPSGTQGLSRRGGPYAVARPRCDRSNTRPLFNPGESM